MNLVQAQFEIKCMSPTDGPCRIGRMESTRIFPNCTGLRMNLKKDDITESSKVLGNVVGPLADRDALLETLLKELLAVNVGLARAPRVQVVHLHVEHQGVEVELFHDSAGV